MKNLKKAIIKTLKNKQFIDIISTLILPLLCGFFFIVWFFCLIKYPVLVFPSISIPIIVLYYFSGNVYGGIFAAFAVAAGFLNILFVTKKNDSIALACECIATVWLFIILEAYRSKYVGLKNAFLGEHDRLIREISLKESEIAGNNKIAEVLSYQIKTFRQIGKIIQSFQVFVNDEVIHEKSEYMAFKFVGKGFWKLKNFESGVLESSIEKNSLYTHIKKTSSPIIIDDASISGCFKTAQNSNRLSIIAAPLIFEKKFFGILEGTSCVKGFFSQDDLRRLVLLSETISAVLNNASLYRHLETLAITDGLTDLYTQSHFKERVEEELDIAQNNNLSLSLAILDVDFFKDINDKYGHQAGDAVLKQFSSFLQKRLSREYVDLISRYGGEEFAFVIFIKKPNDVKKFLDKLRQDVEKELFFLSGDCFYPTSVKITISIGFASVKKGVSVVVNDFIKNADAALYEAKNSGKNKVVSFVSNS
ncbi:MAG: sensor domain-containing diguanylate cyclase [Elusimicrobiota bacterium]|jgi:diguanylate cyclase (GGDEF)-like protein|nr:sensor domain-containing diguanylate cyclase [Elusimicrobiota bacterium]